MEGVQVVKHAAFPGFVLGPEAADKPWDKTHEKVLSHTAHVRALDVYLRGRARAYRSLTFSVLRFRLQVTCPTPGLPRSEAAAISSMVSAPVYAIPAVVATRLIAMGCAFSPPLTRQSLHVRRRCEWR